MKRWEHRSFNIIGVVVAATGVLYLYMKHFMHSDDPFAIVNHPWQPTLLSAHVVSAPFFVLLFGMIFRSHTLRKLQSPVPSNRRTGWTSLVSFASMAVSGYFLQVMTSPAWIDAMVLIHITTSLLFVGGYLVHLVIGWRLAWSTAHASRDSPFADGRSVSS